jgi:hypothetical protein
MQKGWCAMHLEVDLYPVADDVGGNRLCRPGSHARATGQGGETSISIVLEARLHTLPAASAAKSKSTT